MVFIVAIKYFDQSTKLCIAIINHNLLRELFANAHLTYLNYWADAKFTKVSTVNKLYTLNQPNAV